MSTPTLSKGGLRLVHSAVDTLFDRLKGRILGPDFVSRRGDKQIFIGHRPEFSIPGLYRQAAVEEATRPNETVLHSLAKVAEGYIDAERERTKARVVNAVQAFLADAAKGKVDTNVETVLGGELADVWRDMTKSLVKIVDAESTSARNMGTLEGVTKINALAGIEDPTVFFVVVRDDDLCPECKSLHLLPDEVTPRAWKLSEVSSGYHKRGGKSPSVGGLHPHCRCTLATLMPGFGFDAGGRVKYIAPDHDEFGRQRG
jgi:hypothetical protein